MQAPLLGSHTPRTPRTPPRPAPLAPAASGSAASLGPRPYRPAPPALRARHHCHGSECHPRPQCLPDRTRCVLSSRAAVRSSPLGLLLGPSATARAASLGPRPSALRAWRHRHAHGSHCHSRPPCLPDRTRRACFRPERPSAHAPPMGPPGPGDHAFGPSSRLRHPRVFPGLRLRRFTGRPPPSAGRLVQRPDAPSPRVSPPMALLCAACPLARTRPWPVRVVLSVPVVLPSSSVPPWRKVLGVMRHP